MSRCAVVGAGGVVLDLHLPALRRVPGVEVAAVCEPNPDRARIFRERSGVPTVYSTLDELIAAGERVDFVDIATPAHTHYALTKRALEAGLHVLVEKPLALSAREGAELDALARRLQLKLGVLQTYRVRTAVLRARAALEAGALGALTGTSITCRWGHDPFIERRGWDWAEMGTRLLLYELGVHYIDLALEFAGPLQRVLACHSVRSPQSGAVTGVTALLEHKSAAVSTIDIAVLTSSRFVRLELFGSKADGCVKLFPEAFATYRGTVHPLKEIAAEARRTAEFVAQGVLDRIGRGRVKSRALAHFRAISGFVAALEDRRLEPSITATSAVKTLEVLDELHDLVALSRSEEDGEPLAAVAGF